MTIRPTYPLPILAKSEPAPMKGVADFVRSLNLKNHEQQLRMVDELFKHGNTLEVQVKELNEQISSLQQEVFKNEGATREVRRENSELKQRYDTLQKELGVMEHKLTDSERLASKPRSQFVDPQNPKHQAPDEASDTNSVGLNLETLAG